MKNTSNPNPLDSFDHVVVLMLENRSFDNLLGALYDKVPTDAPLGKTFEGVLNKDLSCPVPSDAKHQPPNNETNISAYPIKGKETYFTPYPDPGEEYSHVNTQLFNVIDGGEKKPYNFPVGKNPNMKGFVKDYIENYKKTVDKDPTYEEYKQIMGYFDSNALPVLSTLAKEFAVFDHWFSSVPSQTWCNRAFWHAGTSWGHVNNGGSFRHFENSASWLKDSIGETLFNQIEKSKTEKPKLSWKVYSDNLVALTSIIHARALLPYHIGSPHHFPAWNDFFKDCKEGKLPSYSFLEPKFWTPHNDMHPSSYDSKHYGESNTGSVLLGEKLIYDVYNAIKNSTNSGSNWENTLLIITFDEHGGCYDHVSPSTGVSNPDDSSVWEDFEFNRLGIRVPMVMVSAHIKKNTIVNGQKEHSSFIKTMQKKWGTDDNNSFPNLTHRTQNAECFSEVFTSPEPRPTSDWPDIQEPNIPSKFHEIDFSDAPLNDLQKSMLFGVSLIDKKKRPNEWQDSSKIKTVGEAEAYLQTIPYFSNKNHLETSLTENTHTILKKELDGLGLNFQEPLYHALTKYLESSIYNKDTSLVACSDAEELKEIKDNFLKGKLGLEDSPKLDEIIKDVCHRLGQSNRQKNRVTFYYLLVVLLKKESIFI